MSDMLESIVELTASLMHAARCSLMVLDSQRQMLLLGAAQGISGEPLRFEQPVGEGIVGRVAASRLPLCIPTGANAHPGHQNKDYRSDGFLCMPVMTSDEPLGVLCVTDPLDGRTFGDSDLSTLHAIARHTAACLRPLDTRRLTLMLREIDTLTGLWHYDTFQERIAEEVEKAERLWYPLSLVILKLHVHEGGVDEDGSQHNEILRRTARRLRHRVRSTDILACHLSDQFVAILPGTHLVGATMLAQRLRVLVTAPLALDSFAQTRSLELAVSIGVAAYPGSSTDLASFIAMADQAVQQSSQHQTGATCVARTNEDQSLAFEFIGASDQYEPRIHHQ